VRKKWTYNRLSRAIDEIDGTVIPLGRYVFVALVFSLLGLSFIASTALVIAEFGEAATAIVFAHSHLFLFFPTLGISALVAFYFPAVVFTDIYWRYAPYGKPRFIFGTLVWIALSVGLTWWFAAGHLRAIWEISPSILAQEKLAADRCTGPDCRPTSLMGAMGSLRETAKTRTTISEFARTCVPDRYVEPADSANKPRFCFAAAAGTEDPNAKLSAAECCTAQRALRQNLRTIWENPANRSRVALFDDIFFALKVAFIIVVVLIGALLTFWRHTLYAHYARYIQTIDRCVMIGALLMLFWPLMDYAYQQTTDVLFGREYRGFPLRMSLVLAPWAVFLLLYFADPFGRGFENLARILTVLGSAVAFLRYQDIADISVRLLGIGAADWHFAVLILIAALMLVAVWWRPRPKQKVRYHHRVRRIARNTRHAYARADRRLT
jgi:hypothetical protein